MADETKSFGETAVSLAKNPLGIIALFIVLVYGFASMVIIFDNKLTTAERMPLIYFMIGFPVLVLAVFTWIVIKYPRNLFGPGDYKDEKNYVQMMTVVASLAAATAQRANPDTPPSEADLNKIVDVVRSTAAASPPGADDSWRNHILWVDDNPDNNTFVGQAFEAAGVRITLALSTNEAFEKLTSSKFVAIISDMGRREGPREGYVLLDKLRNSRDTTPLFFFASSNAPEHKAETTEHGGQGCTNNAQELFQMVMNVVTATQKSR